MECYKPSNTNFNKNGDIKLQPLNAILKLELNGICEIEFEHSYDKEGRWKTIENFGVIKSDVCYSKNPQLFRIYDVSKGMFGVKVKTRHIYFDLIDKNIIDSRAVNFNCETALNLILTGTPFKGHSDIDLTNTAYFIKMNALSAISGDSDNTILNRWGGEVIADNFDVYVNNRIGDDYGVKVKYARNMLDIDLVENTDEISTRVYPQAYNGIMLPELYIDSPLINKYPIIKERYMDLGDLKLKEDCRGEDEEGFETKEALYEAMRQKVKEAYSNGLDKPRISGKVDIAILENTEEYKEFKNLVNIGIGDTLTVEHKNIGVDIKTRCVGLEWDILNKKYNSVTLGELYTDYFDKQDLVKEHLENILNKDGSVKAESLHGIVSGLNAKFQALRDVAQPQEVLAMLFEDKIEGSKTYGALAIGSMGLMIANKRTLDDKDWAWNTFIQGGLVYADWLIGKLKTVLIENADGSLQIDLSGTDGVKFLKHGIKAIEIAGNIMKFNDWDGIGDPIAEIFSSRLGGDENRPSLTIGNTKEGCISIGYRDENNPKTYPRYMLFDIHNLSGEAPYPIMMNKPVCFDIKLVLDRDGLNEMHTSIGKDFINKATNYWGVVGSNLNWKMKLGNESLCLYNLNTNKSYAKFTAHDFTFWDSNTNAYFFVSDIRNLVSKLKFFADNGMVVNNDLQVYGNKNCIQKTEKYGDRNFYSVEDCESYLTDRSMHLMTVEEVKHGDKVSYERVILLDNVFKDSVNLDIDYTVEIIKQSWGDYRIKEQTKDYFIVEADRPDFTFKYVITAKRKGFEDERNKEVFLDAETYSLHENNSSGAINTNNDLNINDINNLPNPINNEYWRLYTKNKIAGDSK